MAEIGRRPLALLLCVAGLSACASGSVGPRSIADIAAEVKPTPDPRVGLAQGIFDAGEAIWNLGLLSSNRPPRAFVGHTNTDLAFKDRYAIQGNSNGVIVWDISDPAQPTVVVSYECPASQGDVSVYGNLLFVSGEDLGARLDCGTEGVQDKVSPERFRGIRIFDISDIRNPRYIANVQTCRGSHTHTLLEDPDDRDNIYIYVSGSSLVRPAEELAGCSSGLPDEDPNTALFRIEVIRVPLAAPEQAAIVSSPRLFAGLVAPPEHGWAPAEMAQIDSARAAGAFLLEYPDTPLIMPDEQSADLLRQVVAARGGTGAPTAADSVELRAFLRRYVETDIARSEQQPQPGPTQCHDITVYPAIGLAGGACEGYGMLIDISDPVNPVRIDAVSDENFSYWHSATFNNDGTKILFSDEWGGGAQPKCRETDPMDWGADAIFTVDARKLRFQSYYKMPAPQTSQEVCVAHNGGLIPIPGRDVMVQSWYEGGVSVFDWTDPARPVEIAYHDRGPLGGFGGGGSWSVYWYNGVIVSSEIVRGLDIFELMPSALLTQNEIDASKTVRLDHLNTQGQPRFVWPATFALARAYLDQLERSGGLSSGRIRDARGQLDSAEAAGPAGGGALAGLAAELDAQAAASADAEKVRMLASAIRDLSAS